MIIVFLINLMYQILCTAKLNAQKRFHRKLLDLRRFKSDLIFFEISYGFLGAHLRL